MPIQIQRSPRKSLDGTKYYFSSSGESRNCAITTKRGDYGCFVMIAPLSSRSELVANEGTMSGPEFKYIWRPAPKLTDLHNAGLTSKNIPECPWVVQPKYGLKTDLSEEHSSVICLIQSVKDWMRQIWWTKLVEAKKKSLISATSATRKYWTVCFCCQFKEKNKPNYQN